MKKPLAAKAVILSFNKKPVEEQEYEEDTSSNKQERWWFFDHSCDLGIITKSGSKRINRSERWIGGPYYKPGEHSSYYKNRKK